MAAIGNFCSSITSPIHSNSNSRPSITKPSFFKPLPVKTKPISITLSSPSSITISSPSSISLSSPTSSYDMIIHKPEPHIVETLIETLVHNPIIRTALVAAVTAAAAFFFRFSHRQILAPPPPPTVVFIDEEVSSLRDQMIAKKDDEEYEEAFEILKKLLEIQPEEIEWQIYKGQMLMCYGDTESARLLFNEIIKRYPLRADVYNCLLGASCADSEPDAVVEEIKDMVEEAMKSAKDNNLIELKLVVADCHERLWNIKEAMRIYDEVIMEDPQDFRPYFCKWILYKRLNEEEEADECLEKYKILVPKDHPLKKQCDNFIKNMTIVDCDTDEYCTRCTRF